MSELRTLPGKHYPIYYKGLSETHPKEALICAMRLAGLGYREHAKAVMARFTKKEVTAAEKVVNEPNDTLKPGEKIEAPNV